MSTTETKTLMSVGELAEKAGVTIRTLQFYDQKGLLVPSVKGPRNRRLYSDKDQERLYEILCYKYMGLSLDEIQEKLNKDTKPDDITDALREEISELERTISNCMKRYAVLKDLESISARKDENPDNWSDYSEVVDYIKVKWEMIWQFNEAYKSEHPLDDAPADGSLEMKQYYNLLAKTISMLNQGVSPEDDRMMVIMDQYYALNPDQSLLHVDPDNMKIGNFNAAQLWTDIKVYMHKAADHYFKTRSV